MRAFPDPPPPPFNTNPNPNPNPNLIIYSKSQRTPVS